MHVLLIPLENDVGSARFDIDQVWLDGFVSIERKTVSVPFDDVDAEAVRFAESASS